MSTVTRTFNCPPEQVFDVLANGWLYPGWVVGATRMRNVEESWPAAGARLHHSIGVWPAVINDSTGSLAWDPPTLMRLKARGWPLGTAEVTLTVVADGAGCKVTISEDVLEGPGRVIPKFARSPVISWRNTEALRRLAFLAEGRGNP